MAGVQVALLTVTVPLSTGAVAGPCSARLASTTERMPSGYRSRMSCAGRGDVEFAQLVAGQADAARRTGPARRRAARADARRAARRSRVECRRCRSAPRARAETPKWRRRPSESSAVAGDHRRVGRARQSARPLRRGPELRMSGQRSPAAPPRFAAPLALSASACFGEVDRAREIELGVLADQPQRIDAAAPGDPRSSGSGAALRSRSRTSAGRRPRRRRRRAARPGCRARRRRGWCRWPPPT